MARPMPPFPGDEKDFERYVRECRQLMFMRLICIVATAIAFIIIGLCMAIRHLQSHTTG